MTQVCQDMSPACLKRVRAECRNATVIQDKYHVIANLILATDRVRRREQKQQPSWKDSRWLWRKSPENLNADQAAELAVLKPSNLATVKAYQMRLAFQDADRLAGEAAARRRLVAWCRWVRGAARRFGGWWTPMGKCADSVERHLDGIVAHWRDRLTTAFLEGLNSVFGAVKRRARGFRSFE